jgi:uncharacterized protein (TIGR02391 family)
MRTKLARGNTIPPTILPAKAIELLKRQIGRGEELKKKNFGSADVTAWKSTTEAVLHGTFGKPDGQADRRTTEFLNASAGSVQIGNPASFQRYQARTLEKQTALLSAYIEQMEDLIVPTIPPRADQYVFHARVEKVSGDLLRDGHYKHAALEAFICVIEQVKLTSARTDLDGDNLMNQVFGSENNRIPILKFNELQTDADRDEQKGMMLLFKGIVSLRNAKAHSNTLFDSPQRAHEYLALASLLMRLLEIATT